MMQVLQPLKKKSNLKKSKAQKWLGGNMCNKDKTKAPEGQTVLGPRRGHHRCLVMFIKYTIITCNTVVSRKREIFIQRPRREECCVIEV